MKTNSKILIALFLLFLCGCDNDVKYRYYTRINPDGTVFKRVVAIGDSASIYAQPFPFDVTNGWSVNYKKDTVHNDQKIDTVYFAIAEKTFKTMADVQLAFSHNIDSLKHENIVFEQHSKFRWFYTYNTYKETFLQRFPIRRFPIDQYLTPLEQSFFIYEDKSMLDSMTKQQADDFSNGCNEKWERYMGENVLAEFFYLLDSYSDSLCVSPVSLQTRDSVRASFSVIKDESWDSLYVNIDRFDHRNLASKANEEGRFSPLVNLFEDADWFESEGSDYEVEVDVPGLLYKSNGVVVEPNTVKWIFTGNHFAYSDYVMEVNYRVANIWAFVVSALIALGLMWILILKKR